MERPINRFQTFKYHLSTAIFFMSLLITPSISHSENIDDTIQKGQKLAQKLCSNCHAINKEDISKNKKAPPFRTLSEKWPLENLEEALAEGIVVGHDDMPEFKFNPDEIADFIAFLESLQQKKTKEPS